MEGNAICQLNYANDGIIKDSWLSAGAEYLLVGWAYFSLDTT